MMNLGIKELHEKLINKEVTSEELVRESIDKSIEVQEICNSFVTIMNNPVIPDVTDNLLSGIPYGIKDNYSTRGILSTGCSNTLKDYVPFYTATAVSKLESAGAVAVNKTAMDEFGMGGTGTSGHIGIQLNPWNLQRMCAGSSSGSAAAVAAGVYPYALGSDTGDSIRKPAAYCGVVGYKPTYGMISRYGLFAYASSLDHCGVIARSVEDCAIVVDAMKGIDGNDMTTWDSSSVELYNNLNNDVKGKKLAYIKEITSMENYPNASDNFKEYMKLYNEVIEKAKSIGMIVEEVSIDKKLLDALSSVYTVISYAEATSNLSNLTGISFGPRGNGSNINEMMMDYRTNGFSSLIKRRFVIGSYCLEAENQDRYFVNAQKVRRLLVDSYKNIFKDYDGIILPVSTGIAPYLDNSLNTKEVDDITILDEHLQIDNFGGFPSITIPCGFVNEMPVGVNIASNCYLDSLLLNIASSIEGTMSYKNQVVGSDK